MDKIKYLNSRINLQYVPLYGTYPRPREAFHRNTCIPYKFTINNQEKSIIMMIPGFLPVQVFYNKGGHHMLGLWRHQIDLLVLVKYQTAPPAGKETRYMFLRGSSQHAQDLYHRTCSNTTCRQF